jgi:hypothetical protein
MKIYQVFQLVTIITEAIAFITGLLHWKKVRNSYWKWFVIYLGVITLCEILGYSFSYLFKSTVLNRHLYNYFVVPLELLFFFWLFYRDLTDRLKRLLVSVAIGIYLVSFLVNVIMLPDVNFWFFPFSYLFGIIVMLTLSISFFIRPENTRAHYKQNMMFWISLGILIFFLVSSPFYVLRSALYYNYTDLFWIYYYVQFGATYLMYILFSMAFIYGKPRL